MPSRAARNLGVAGNQADPNAAVNPVPPAQADAAGIPLVHAVPVFALSPALVTKGFLTNTPLEVSNYIKQRPKSNKTHGLMSNHQAFTHS